MNIDAIVFAVCCAGFALLLGIGIGQSSAEVRYIPPPTTSTCLTAPAVKKLVFEYSAEWRRLGRVGEAGP